MPAVADLVLHALNALLTVAHVQCAMPPIGT